MFKWFKQLKELAKPLKVRMYLGILALFILVGLIIQQIQFVFIILFMLLLIYFSKQGEAENQKILQVEKKPKQEQELFKLQKRIEVLREHVEKNDQDIDTKLKLVDMESEYAILKNEIE